MPRPASAGANAWLPRSVRFLACPGGGDWRISFSVKPADLPERSFVKRRWQPEQAIADQVKEKPECRHAKQQLNEPRRASESFALCQRWSGNLLQTRGANHAVIVFGDALAAEKPGAFRTSRHGFARKMIEAPL